MKSLQELYSATSYKSDQAMEGGSDKEIAGGSKKLSKKEQLERRKKVEAQLKKLRLQSVAYARP